MTHRPIPYPIRPIPYPIPWRRRPQPSLAHHPSRGPI
jgi:hypothetical protein